MRSRIFQPLSEQDITEADKALSKSFLWWIWNTKTYLMDVILDSWKA